MEVIHILGYNYVVVMFLYLREWQTSIVVTESEDLEWKEFTDGVESTCVIQYYYCNFLEEYYRGGKT